MQKNAAGFQKTLRPHPAPQNPNDVNKANANRAQQKKMNKSALAKQYEHKPNPQQCPRYQPKYQYSVLLISFLISYQNNNTTGKRFALF